MPRFLHYTVHPDSPQPRLLRHAAAVIAAGGVAAVPTATGYLLACRLDDKAASTRLRRLAGQTERDPAVLLCRDLAQAAVYLRIDDAAFRLIRGGQSGPGPWLLPCTKRVPRRLLTSRAVAQLCFAGQAATQALLTQIDEALLMSPPGQGVAAVDGLPPAWREGIDLVVDAGPLATWRWHTDDADAVDASPALAGA